MSKYSTLGGRGMRRLLQRYRQHKGITGIVRGVLARIRHPHPRCTEVAQRMVRGHGLEIGGPTPLFRSRFPLYDAVGGLDNCNFGAVTVWEGSIAAGPTFVYNPLRAPGMQYVLDATALKGIPSAKYDFVIASHVLEHVANPIKALREWTRVVVPGGSIIVIVPHKDGTFDHRRPVTPVAHMLEDAERDVGEDDLTHVPEVLAHHDFQRDPGAGSVESFKERCLDNAKQRCLHHHTFTSESAIALLQAAGLHVRIVEPLLGCHIILLAEVPEGAGEQVVAPFVYESPFTSDRRAT